MMGLEGLEMRIVVLKNNRSVSYSYTEISMANPHTRRELMGKNIPD